MEKLSIKSLQIGDWVTGKKWKEKPFQITRINDGGRFVYGKTANSTVGPFFIEELEPIPFTSEILEKFRFNKVPQQGCSNPYYWMMEKYEDESEGLLYRITAYKTPFRGMYVSIDNYADCEPIKFSKQIEHFHELQHTLRLCGLNDLADNLKDL